MVGTTTALCFPCLCLISTQHRHRQSEVDRERALISISLHFLCLVSISTESQHTKDALSPVYLDWISSRDVLLQNKARHQLRNNTTA